MCISNEQNEIFYFRNKQECDFVIRVGTKINEAYQVCYALDDFNREREIGGLLEVLQKFNLKEGFLITLNQEDELLIEHKKIIIKPAWKWLLNDNF